MPFILPPMLPLQLSSIRCIKRRYEFSDGSVVLWTPNDGSGKAHASFTVDICLKAYGGVYVARLQKEGPPSEKTSLHWLKWEIKEYVNAGTGTAVHLEYGYE